MATDSLNAPRSAHSPLRNSLMVCALMLLAMPGLASADRARVQSLGGVDLLMEDESNLFINPAHISSYSNRAWFSLGVILADVSILNNCSGFDSDFQNPIF